MNFEHIVYLISTIRDNSYQFITDALVKNNINGLVPSHGSILFQLFKNKEMSMKELSNKINRDKSTVTALVNKLIKLRFVVKKENPNDKRGFQVFITEKGLLLEPIFQEISKNLIKKISIGLVEKDKENVVKILNVILKNLME